MMLVLLSLMGFHLWNENIHEWLGITFFFISLLHLSLNTHWLKKLFQGEYSAFRFLQVALNLLLLLLFVTAIVSGVMLSKHAVPDLPIHSSSDFVRKAHMTSVHWIQVIIAVHIGMHWKMLAKFFCAIWNISPISVLACRIVPAIFIIVSAYGLYVFINRDMLPYLLVQVDFAFFDFEEGKLLFYRDYFTIAIFFAYLTRVSLGLVFRK